MSIDETEQKMTPHMPELAISALSSRLMGAKCYLEYGSGGSTVLAADLGVPKIISVDTSIEWSDKVKSNVERMSYGGELKIFHVNIGRTKKWGYPVNDAHIRQWSRYFFEPWKFIYKENISPDLVLIDGRFRVCCFLASLAHAQVGTTLLFDDYVGRGYYHAVEKLLKPISRHDRMAEFKKVAEPSASALLEMMSEFLFDTR
jgi:hypothetical protein